MHCSNLTGVLIGLVALGVAPVASAQSAEAPDAGTLRCESRDGRLRECPLDTRGGVRLAKQLSRSECVRGRSWGISRDGVWVSDGCRADFAYGYGMGADDDRLPGNRDRTLRCESKNGRWKHCPTDTEGRVEFVRQLSRGICLRNQNWGVDLRGVWVSGGCRAEFRISVSEARPDRGGVQVVRCESSDGRQEHCPVSTRGGVRVARQISRTACIEGHNWRFDRNGIWVKEGCRADFEVGYRHDPEWGLGRNE
jgi:hypothetical protein